MSGKPFLSSDLYWYRGQHGSGFNRVSPSDRCLWRRSWTIDTAQGEHLVVDGTQVIRWHALFRITQKLGDMSVSWRCRSGARLRYSSEGGYLRPSGLGRLGRLGAMIRALGNLPRPVLWLPYVFTSHRRQLRREWQRLGLEAED